MHYMVSIDVPNLEQGIRFYCAAFGFEEIARPVESYAILARGGSRIGIIEKAPGSKPAKETQDVRRYDRHWTPVHIDFHVDDFEETLSLAIDAGAACEERFETGKHPPVAFCSDPFGNGFCLIGTKATES